MRKIKTALDTRVKCEQTKGTIPIKRTRWTPKPCSRSYKKGATRRVAENSTPAILKFWSSMKASATSSWTGVNSPIPSVASPTPLKKIVNLWEAFRMPDGPRARGTISPSLLSPPGYL